MKIGDWIQRQGPESDDEDAKWHAVESIISGAAITRCGRRMEPEVDGFALAVSPVMPLTRMIGQPQLCKAGCDTSE